VRAARSLAAGLGAIALALAACSEKNAVEQPPPSPPLCVLTGSDGSVEGWLLGTIHALPDGTAWRTPALEEIIDTADLALVEVADPAGDEARAIFVELARTPGLPALTERVAPSLRAAVADLIEKTGARPGDFTGTETWAAALTLAQAASPGSRRNSVDKAVIAAFADRPVRELEGVARQLGIFDALPSDDQRALLEGIVLEAGEAEDKRSALDRAWLTGDLAAIEQASATGFLADPQLRAALLTDRNAAWAARIASELEQGERPLIAVGAAHLPGEHGLIRLLERRGFACARVH
jgi:uncharacterized protein YbaP (TraB family)